MPEPQPQASLLRPLTVVAFGGNALLQARDLGTVEEQMRRAEEAAIWLAEVSSSGHDLLIVHGNGPQVGQVLIQMEGGRPVVPPGTMDIAVAETQGSMGYLLDLALRNRFREVSLDRQVATVMSLVVVDGDDPGFEHPTKPVGPFFSRYQAEELDREMNWKMIDDAGRGWRKVVASPRPLAMLGMTTVEELLSSGAVVIAGGGGGVPVVRDDDGDYRGVEAVIDKDRTAAMLAIELKAAALVIVTDIDRVYRNFGKRSQRPVRAMTLRQGRKMLADGQFPPGSMGPKVESAIRFVEETGGRGVITNSENFPLALEGLAGTTIVRTPAERRQILARRARRRSAASGEAAS